MAYLATRRFWAAVAAWFVPGAMGVHTDEIRQFVAPATQRLRSRAPPTT